MQVVGLGAPAVLGGADTKADVMTVVATIPMAAIGERPQKVRPTPQPTDRPAQVRDHSIENIILPPDEGSKSSNELDVSRSHMTVSAATFQLNSLRPRRWPIH
jgi:hypothetical protein